MLETLALARKMTQCTHFLGLYMLIVSFASYYLILCLFFHLVLLEIDNVGLKRGGSGIFQNSHIVFIKMYTWARVCRHAYRNWCMRLV